jgi:hypothetical protein
MPIKLNLDRVMLDLPEPWRVVKHAEAALHPGGILLAYLPTIGQVARLREEKVRMLARLANAGDRSGEVTINTSEGPYRIPLEATGVGFAAQPTAAPNYEGLWWNAPGGSESGWGINFAHQGDVIFATWFTYDVNGKAMWLTMSALLMSDVMRNSTYPSP